MNAETQPIILVVDDQVENLAVLSALLQPHYRVRAARSGEQALRVALSPPLPDLALLDVMMPEMDGYSLLARLREKPVTAGIPVLFVTALAAEEDEERGLALGAVDYITKPIKPAVVLARVRTHLELKRARDQLAAQNTVLEDQVAQRTATLKQTLQRVEESNALLRKTHFETLMAFGELAGQRGKEFAEHGRRVADVSRQVAFRMGLDAPEAQDVFIAALLHDVGKIGFPENLLSKPVHAMNRGETDNYRRHAALGGEIIERIGTLARVADIIAHHHEHYDGSGFPAGLSGLQIPIGARIVCAVNDHDNLRQGVLTSQPMSAKEACQYLVAEQGTRYDPMVIGALEPILKADGNFEIDELLVPVQHLREGMTLSREVLHSNGFVLLARNAVMTQTLINQLMAVERQSGAKLKVHVVRASTLPNSSGNMAA